MFRGAIDEVAEGVFRDGSRYLESVSPEIFRPVRPMLAQPSQSVDEALETMDQVCALEYKLDGARIQIHKQGEKVRLFSRSLRDLTDNLPEVADRCVELVSAGNAILDGEVIAIGPGGEPLPFQTLSKRITAGALSLEFAEPTRVHLFLFDLLLVDDRPVFGLSFEKRCQLLESAASPDILVPSLVRPSLADARAFFDRAVAEGHEGLVAKHLESTYRPGSRGKQWLKIKKKITLDLVIVAAEYGYGRRHGWLSNYLLATRDETTGGFLPVGKTFKGLSDSEFEDMTTRLTSLKTSEIRGGITVRPEVVVEVSFGEIQKSRRYDSGYALRFARIERVRDDKSPDEIDTLQNINSIYTKGGSKRADK
jgi:DNA ligase-1